MQDFAAGVVARKRESHLALRLAQSRKLFSIDAPSLSCNIEKFLWVLGKLSGLDLGWRLWAAEQAWQQ